jgi:hypothetical protein
MPELARVLLLLLALAVAWNAANGTLGLWLRAKLLGQVPPPGTPQARPSRNAKPAATAGTV